MAKTWDDRTPLWTFILYPESAPPNWREILGDMHIPICISPEHNKDINKDGTLKKAHYHIILKFDSNKSYRQVEEITQSLSQPIPQKVISMKGECRYLCHLDESDPKKPKYKTEDVVTLGGFDFLAECTQTMTEELAVLDEILDFIMDNNITEYYTLVNICRRSNRDWYKALATKHSYIVINFIKSLRNSGGVKEDNAP